MSIGHASTGKAERFVHLIKHDILEHSLKGDPILFYREEKMTELMKECLEEPFIRTYIVNYYKNNGFDCVYDSTKKTLMIGWEPTDEGNTEADYWFRRTVPSSQFICDCKEMMILFFKKMESLEKQQFTYVLGKELVGLDEYYAAARYLANKVKEYCDERDYFYDCEIEEVDGEIRFYFKR